MIFDKEKWINLFMILNFVCYILLIVFVYLAIYREKYFAVISLAVVFGFYEWVKYDSKKYFENDDL